MKYDPEFPEKGEWWNLIDSVRLTDLADKIAREIKDDLRTPDRQLTAGLRVALRFIHSTTR